MERVGERAVTWVVDDLLDELLNEAKLLPRPLGVWMGASSGPKVGDILAGMKIEKRGLLARKRRSLFCLPVGMKMGSARYVFDMMKQEMGKQCVQTF